MARWVVPLLDTGAAKRLAAEAGVTEAMSRILLRRGYTDRDMAEAYLRPHIGQLLAPAGLADLERAAGRLHQAVRAGEKILLYGDYDVDGTTAIVILSAAISVTGGTSEFYVPHRLKEGYGMRSEVVERAAADGVRLIVSVDTGIRAGEVVRHATALGIDVIVTDHHLPEQELPPAVAVVNPNRPDCTYANKSLCGAGVAFKVAQALMELQGWPDAKLRRMRESFLKLAAIATVADVVPLAGENRAIVKLGLHGFSEVRNLGLRELLRVAGIEEGRPLTAREVGFQIGPRINAAGRMESARMVVELFQTNDPARAAEIAGELDALNRDRRETEKRILNEILEQLDRPAEGLVLAGEGWHRGVVGIVASRVVERVYRPTFVLEIDRANGVATGSGRSIPAFHLLDSLDSMSELFAKYGGHSHAAGVTLPLDRVDEFRERFSAYARTHLTPDDLTPECRIDAVVEPSEVKGRFIDEYLDLAPFGYGNPLPVLMMRGVTVVSSDPIGSSGKHRKACLEFDGARQYVKAWNFEARAEELAPGRRIDAAVTIRPDDYWGWTLQLEDVRAGESVTSS